MNARSARSAGASAILFAVVLVVTGFAAGTPPQADDSVAKISTYFGDHRGVLLVSLFLSLLATPLVVWFFAVIRQAVAGDATDNALGLAAMAGIVLAGAMALAGGAVGEAVIYVKDSTFSDDLLRFMFELQTLLFASTSAGLVVATGAIAWATRRTKALPAVTVWVGLLAVLGNIATMFSVLDASVASIGFAGLLTFSLFLLVTGGAMIAGAGRSTSS